ncbi:uncharacterized protein SCHCODRAFT_01129253 [Schizophyllum commune H4-8]|uniref:Uncharacterized protein n=1 Tax=Schizophyllum commune (strain H4-8 / FGSC 9210) TaxID=578458 RepID=D8Q967_SCHCM|nr:uncharacterized protein SCHCODRAFT_01129253 [Schizophyllum commune H4-8]KAI5890532.1 hypothetical protein SCHCODRAFT_01129253 [Schizophyllum commune H4-8]
MQGDSVRYLNDLNTWLEGFVTDGTAKIEGMAANVATISAAFGAQGQGQNPLDEMRQLAEEMRSRDQNTAALHDAVGRLFGELGGQGGVGGVQQVLEMQRQNQEVLVRSLASELTKEIRDERLRFVDAMQEATSLNVTAQVEDFKQQMSKEVRAMIHDVQRLHAERQAMQNQIADLFSFYSKYENEKGGPPEQRPPPMAANQVNHPRYVVNGQHATLRRC